MCPQFLNPWSCSEWRNESLYNSSMSVQHQGGTTPQPWECESKLIWVRIETSSEILKQLFQVFSGIIKYNVNHPLNCEMSILIECKENVSVVCFPASETTLVAELHMVGLCFPVKPFPGAGNLAKDIRKCVATSDHKGQLWLTVKGGWREPGEWALCFLSNWFYHHNYNWFHELVRKKLLSWMISSSDKF